MEQLVAAIEGFNRPKGAFFGFETITTPKVKKGYKGVVTIRSVFSAQVGISYENAINNRLEKMGEDRDFEAQKPKGMHHISENSYILQGEKNPNQFYLAVSKVGGNVKTFFIDGREATADEVADIKANWLYKSSPNKFNMIWRTFKVEGITAVR